MIVSCRLESSFKNVRSKTTLPNIGLLIDVPANDTVVPLASCRSVPPCFSIYVATSLLTKDACAPLSNKVVALYDGLFPTEIQHMR